MNPVPISEQQRQLATWISEAGADASLEPLIDASEMFLLDASEAREIIRGVAEVTAQWRKVGRMAGLTDNDFAPYETAFEHEELKAAQRIV